MVICVWQPFLFSFPLPDSVSLFNKLSRSTHKQTRSYNSRGHKDSLFANPPPTTRFISCKCSGMSIDLLRTSTIKVIVVAVIITTWGGWGSPWEILLVHTIPQAIGNVARDRPPDLGGRHFAQLRRRRVAVEGGMWCTQDVGSVLQSALQRQPVRIGSTQSKDNPLIIPPGIRWTARSRGRRERQPGSVPASVPSPAPRHRPVLLSLYSLEMLLVASAQGGGTMGVSNGHY